MDFYSLWFPSLVAHFHISPCLYLWCNFVGGERDDVRQRERGGEWQRGGRQEEEEEEEEAQEGEEEEKGEKAPWKVGSFFLRKIYRVPSLLRSFKVRP